MRFLNMHKKNCLRILFLLVAWLCFFYTVKFLNIGTPQNNKTFICSKCKLVIFMCPKIWAHNSLIIMCSNIGTPKTFHFPFGTNGKLMVLGVPLLKHFRVVKGATL